MKRALSLAVLGLLFLSTGFSSKAYAAAPDDTIASRIAEVNGVKLHYLTAGHGTALLLLHGYAETSRMWRPIIPALARRFTVIAPDLPGIGDSDIPADGLDMKSAAIRIHDLQLDDKCINIHRLVRAHFRIVVQRKLDRQPIENVIGGTVIRFLRRCSLRRRGRIRRRTPLRSHLPSLPERRHSNKKSRQD